MFKKKNKILSIQINDEKINQDVVSLIQQVMKTVDDLKKTLADETQGDKDKELDRLEKIFLEIHKDVEILIEDVTRIRSIELQRKEYITLNDNQFLKDKLKQLYNTRQDVEKLVDMFEVHPTAKEIKRDLLDTMIIELNKIVDSMNQIIADDKSLENIYKKITP